MYVKDTKNHVILRISGGLLSAGKVVIAINAWTSQLLPELTNVIMPVREQMLAYAPIAPIFSPGISIDLVAGEYMQQTPHGAILIGGCGSVAPHADVGIWESQPTAVVQEAIEQILPCIFPSLFPQLQVEQRWAGLLGCTTDMHPIVDKGGTMPDVFFVGGFSGHGMRLGQLLATAITSGSLPPCPQTLSTAPSFTEKMGAPLKKHKSSLPTILIQGGGQFCITADIGIFWVWHRYTMAITSSK